MDALATLALEHGDYREHGYKVERIDGNGWALLDPDGAYLCIGGHGCVAPRKSDAEIEAYRRITDELP